MTDPIQGSVSALQNLQNVGQADLDASSKAADSKTPATSFEDVMNTQVEPASDPLATAKVDAAQAPDKIDPAKKLDDFVKGVFDDQSRIEEMMARCVDGKNLSQGELLQLQGVIYAYAQKVDLASKVVDKATGGLKQVMNTQV